MNDHGREDGGPGSTEARTGFTIRLATETDTLRVAQLHTEAIAEGFLSTLGLQFLNLLYRRIVRAPGSVLVVSVDDRDVISGFVAATDDTPRLYRHFLLRDAVRACWAAAPSVARAPRRVWETLRYGTADDASQPAAEILAIAVDNSARGHGIGGALVNAAIDHLRTGGVTEVKVVTAADNAPALRMYKKVGFVDVGTAEVHPGTVQKVLLWR